MKSPVKRSLSQHAKLRPLVDKAPKEAKKVELKKIPSKDKIKPVAEIKSNKLIEAKLKNITSA